MGDKRDIEGGSGEWEGGGSVVKYVVVECQASKLARKYLVPIETRRGTCQF